jgi:hypothetical protein
MNLLMAVFSYSLKSRGFSFSTLLGIGFMLQKEKEWVSREKLSRDDEGD